MDPGPAPAERPPVREMLDHILRTELIALVDQMSHPATAGQPPARLEQGRRRAA